MRSIFLWTLAFGLAAAGAPVSRAQNPSFVNPYLPPPAGIKILERRGQLLIYGVETFDSTAQLRYYERILPPPLNLVGFSKSPTQLYYQYHELDPQFSQPKWDRQRNWGLYGPFPALRKGDS